MTLSEKQRMFTRMVGQLIHFAYSNGYELTFGDAYAKDGHMPNSLHYSRLAVDFNLFINGVYQTDGAPYTPLGEYWESIGGAWGGRFGAKSGGIGNDSNHFSLEHEGRR